MNRFAKNNAGLRAARNGTFLSSLRAFFYSRTIFSSFCYAG